MRKILLSVSAAVAIFLFCTQIGNRTVIECVSGPATMKPVTPQPTSEISNGQTPAPSFNEQPSRDAPPSSAAFPAQMTQGASYAAPPVANSVSQDVTQTQASALQEAVVNPHQRPGGLYSGHADDENADERSGWADPFQFLNTSWADGCCDIFLDVGANLGHHARMVFEPWKYNRSKYLKYFQQHFGSPELRRRSFNESCVCAFGFEANPQHEDLHRQIEKTYSAFGWRIKFFTPMAVGPKDGKVKLSVNNGPWAEGASILLRDKQHDRKKRKWHTVSVPMVDFAKGLKAHLLNRRAPRKGKIVMKMDIEGAEFDVLPAMVKSGLLCQEGGITLGTLEWHERILDAIQNKHLTPSVIKQMIDDQVGCTPTKISTLDDEEYWNERVALP